MGLMNQIITTVQTNFGSFYAKVFQTLSSWDTTTIVIVCTLAACAFPTVMWSFLYICKLIQLLLFVLFDLCKYTDTIPWWVSFFFCFFLLFFSASNLSMYFGGAVDMKKKYNAKWALVTGAGTGIGKSIAETMAHQGLNVVLVSMPDKFLGETTKELKSKFPGTQSSYDISPTKLTWLPSELEFRPVGAHFARNVDYMPTIIAATADIDIPIVFNNAGYIVTGFFDQTKLDSQLDNLECNATACVKVTHHFLQKMLAKKMKGCILFTSSVSGYIPNPFAVMYGATKVTRTWTQTWDKFFKKWG